MLTGQNNCLSKKVNLPVGKVMLKTALNAISHQTGCVFSYDPTKVSDKQVINISSGRNLSLRSALTEILPKDIQFKLNGKYVVLQEVSIIPETATFKPQRQPKSSSVFSKVKGTIDKNPVLERLVLPPLINNTETKGIVQDVDQSPKQGTDTLEEREIVIPVENKDIKELAPFVTDTVPAKQVLLSDLKKGDTIKVVRPGINGFIRKNGYLEAGVSINNQLAAFSVHAGLYNIYAILSIGSDYNDSYLLGIGAGVNVKIDTHFSLNFDFLQNEVIAGKSYLLKVNVSNTQIIPVLNYTIGKSIRFFAGPTVNLIKSSYVSSISTTDLGVLVGIGYSVGIKIDLKRLLSK
jgi:hypothetical protein